MTAIASFKAFARDACAGALSFARVTSPGMRLRQRLSIITFHRVLTESQRRQYPLPGLAVTPHELEAHLRFAQRHFRCMSLAAALDLWDRGAHQGPPLLAITFDDGQIDNHQNALPVLERLGVTASFYVPSQILEDPGPLWHDALAALIGQIGSERGQHPDRRQEAIDALMAQLDPMPSGQLIASHTPIEAALEATKAWTARQRHDWIRQAQQLLPRTPRHAWDGFMTVAHMKDLLARGHEIGSHSHSHPLLPQCSPDELVAEIEGSKARLEAALDAPVTTFCYPNGSTDARSVAQVRKAGYRAAVTTRWGSNAPGCDHFELQRFDMNARHAVDRHGRFSEPRLAWRMSGLYPGLRSGPVDAYSGASA